MQSAARIGDMQVCAMVTPGTPPILQAIGDLSSLFEFRDGLSVQCEGPLPNGRPWRRTTCVPPLTPQHWYSTL